MEEKWVAKRSQLRQLLQEQPNWTNQMYADATHMSVTWVKDWKRIFKTASPDDDRVILGRPRHRRCPFEDYDADVIETVLAIRDHPPDYCPRIPGPAVIQYELAQRYSGTKKRYPQSTSTIWKNVYISSIRRHYRMLAICSCLTVSSITVYVHIRVVPVVINPRIVPFPNSRICAPYPTVLISIAGYTNSIDARSDDGYKPMARSKSISDPITSADICAVSQSTFALMRILKYLMSCRSDR